MFTHKKVGFLAAIIFVLPAALLLTACARKKTSEKIVATINNYRMTVEDFNYESKDVLSTAKIFVGTPVTKEDILDALIVKELLLQEAQNMDLDKDKSFMRTIELYWEQTLIRDLLTKKAKEIEKSITVYEDEILDYYGKTKENIKATVLVLTDENAAKRLLRFDGDVSEYAQKDTKKSSLAYVIPSRLYTLGESGTSLENSIFNVSAAKKRALVPIDGKWALIVIEERIATEPEPLPEAREGITSRIKLIKEKELMNEWIEALRSNARIKIDKKVLGELR